VRWLVMSGGTERQCQNHLGATIEAGPDRLQGVLPSIAGFSLPPNVAQLVTKHGCGETVADGGQ
jgi:hypothetical protein